MRTISPARALNGAHVCTCKELCPRVFVCVFSDPGTWTVCVSLHSSESEREWEGLRRSSRIMVVLVL